MERHKGGDENVASSLSIFLEVGKRERGGGWMSALQRIWGMCMHPFVMNFNLSFMFFVLIRPFCTKEVKNMRK